ncbi:MAG: hypothetical protein HRT45_02260, partial [Bdellovibrionales bacterium]|nr:hypothetical protein [Bdellovibrionales bacterium]
MRKPKATTLYKTGLSLLIALTASAWANDSVMVQSTVTNQNIFEVVYDSGNNTTDARQGIYSISSRGKTEAAIIGEVLGVSRGFNGVLAQSAHAASSTADSLAVVDGKLTLFNKNTRTGNAKTRAVKLQDAGFSVFDPYLGQESTEPISVMDLDDIIVRSIAQIPSRGATLPYGGELFVATLRHTNMFGPGLTFAFVVENPKDNSAQPSILRNRAYVLNYNFLNESQINRIKVQEDRGDITLYSSTLLSSTITRYEGIINDPTASDETASTSLRRWVRHLKASQRFFEGSSEGRTSQEMIQHLVSGVPFLDLMSMQPTYLSLPIFDLGNDSFNIRQLYDPRDSTWSVIQIEKNSLNARPASQTGNLYFYNSVSAGSASQIAEGQVSVDNSGKYTLREVNSKNAEDQYALAVGDETLFLLRTAAGLKPVKVPGLNITNLRAFESMHYMQRGTDQHPHAILVSVTEKTGKKRTYAAYVSELENGDLVARSMREISQSFMRAEEMDLRANFAWTDDRKDFILYFDADTPVKGPAAYAKLLKQKDSEGEVIEHTYRDTKYMKHALADDGRNGGRNVYMRTAAVEGILGEQLQHRLYGSKKIAEADKQQSGIYYVPKDETLEQLGHRRVLYPDADQPVTLGASLNGFVAAGKPLWSKGKPGLESVLASSRPIKMGAALELNAIPFQPLGGTPDQAKFQLMLALRNTGSEMPMSFQVLEVPARFDGLLGAQIMQGKRNHEGEFHLLLLFGKSGSDQTGLYLVSGKYSKETKNQFSKHVIELSHSGKWLEKGEVSPSDLKDRIRPDVQGRLYWFDNPDENVDSSRFRV